MGQLPLRVRTRLRDEWEKEDSPVQKALDELGEDLGIGVKVTFIPTMLYDDAKLVVNNPEDILFFAVELVRAWAVALRQQLSDVETNGLSDWADVFLDTMGKNVNVFVMLKLDLDRPKTVLDRSQQDGQFQIWVPRTIVGQSEMQGSFLRDFEKIWDEEDSEEEPQQDRDKTMALAIPFENKPQQLGSPAPPTLTSPPILQVSKLPKLESLPRPESLFSTLLPYHMIVEARIDKIVVQASHAPSLELLTAYLKKNVRLLDNTTDKAPRLEIENFGSNFGFGSFNDRITIKRKNDFFKWIELSPVLVLAFIEGVLGYSMQAQGRDCGLWHYKRAQPFA